MLLAQLLLVRRITMNESPDSKPLEPKLMTKGKLSMMFIVFLVALSWRIMADYGAHGSVSVLTLGSAIVAFVICFGVVAFVGWYANKPEK